MKPKIVVIGSSNTDMVIKTETLPAPGQTVLGGSFFMSAGGKGANQAVAAERLGGDVTFIAKVGDDLFGREAKAGFIKEGINDDYIVTDTKHASGIALINVDGKGENCIAVASGANASLHRDDIDNAWSALEAADIILIQLEIPMDTVDYAVHLAAQFGKTIILNPAPAAALSDEVYGRLSFFTPNVTEAATLSGISVNDKTSAKKAALYFMRKGIRNVIITMGKEGALWCSEKGCVSVASPTVSAVDTTAAGDVFNGALAVAVCEKNSIENAIWFATNAAALSVTKLGAQSSAPYRNETDDFIKSQR